MHASQPASWEVRKARSLSSGKSRGSVGFIFAFCFEKLTSFFSRLRMVVITPISISFAEAYWTGSVMLGSRGRESSMSTGAATDSGSLIFSRTLASLGVSLEGDILMEVCLTR